MMFLPYNFFFFFMLLLGLMISISSVQWIYVWMGLEVNLMSFIPLMMMSKNYYEIESSIKYFFVQALSSSFMLMFIFFIMFYSTYFFFNYMMFIILILCFMLKLGMAPLHFWFPDIMKGLHWYSCFILMSFQKIVPLFFLFYIMYNMEMYFIMIGVMSVFIGSLGGVSQTNLRLLMSYSSISHMGWMVLCLELSFNLMMFYYILYIFNMYMMVNLLNKYSLKNIKTLVNYKLNLVDYMMLMIMLFIISGMPPFMGFLMKFYIIMMMSSMKLFFFSVILVLLSLMSFLYYMLIIMNSLLEMFNSFIFKKIKFSFSFFSFFFFNSSVLLYFLLFIL